MRVTDVINEMARADISPEALAAAKAGDFEKAASLYVKNAKKRNPEMDAKKIIAGLGATFRGYAEIDTDGIAAMKKAVKDSLAGEMPPKAEKKTSSKKEKGVDKEKEAAEAGLSKNKKGEGSKEEEEDSTDDLGGTPEEAAEKKESGSKKGKKTELIKKKDVDVVEDVYYPTFRERILMNAGLLNERACGKKMVGSEGDAGSKKLGKRTHKEGLFGKGKKADKEPDSDGDEVVKFDKKLSKRTPDDKEAIFGKNKKLGVKTCKECGKKIFPHKEHECG
jgi:hypothetical protein